jgi:hypothetical protein
MKPNTDFGKKMDANGKLHILEIRNWQTAFGNLLLHLYAR